MSESEAKALSADFLLEHFICPAIVDPERYGISGNLPVRSMSRDNLMQVAQVLQLAAHEDSDVTTDGSTSMLQVKVSVCVCLIIGIN